MQNIIYTLMICIVDVADVCTYMNICCWCYASQEDETPWGLLYIHDISIVTLYLSSIEGDDEEDDDDNDCDIDDRYSNDRSCMTLSFDAA